MSTQKYHIVGVMSGTSLDGIDLAHITLEHHHNWTFKIHHAETIPYSSFWQQKLAKLITCNLEELKKIDEAYTGYLAEEITNFLSKYDIHNLDAVCSHGHTALHQPEKGLTYQLGNLQTIAKLIKHRVVCDFRVQDVALGGQGAPLVPIGDQLLFSEYEYCINLGGFANISYEHNGRRLAFDICPVNIVLNKFANTLGLEYDDRGAIAKSGDIDKKTLQRLNALQFYSELPPKSLGLEWVERRVNPILEASNLSTRDVLRTVTEHIAMQLTAILKTGSKVLITGGGAYNDFLINRIKSYTTLQLTIPDNTLVEYKEALIFGLLGVLKLRDENNCLSSVTGATKDHSSGEIFNP